MKRLNHLTMASLIPVLFVTGINGVDAKCLPNDEQQQKASKFGARVLYPDDDNCNIDDDNNNGSPTQTSDYVTTYDKIIAKTLFKGKKGEIEYRIFYHETNGNNQPILVKPIVFIDGFDPGDKRKISISTKDHPSLDSMTYKRQDKEIKIVKELVKDKGYDVVIVNQINHTKEGVDIDGGADYIERNAMAHVELYIELNKRLKENGSEEQLVIVGPSMGGQISRYALAYMEKKNIPHNTRLWVSVDSPHLGANIPVGVQAMTDIFAHVMPDSNSQRNAKDKYDNTLKAIASQQQLIEQHLRYGKTDHLNNGSPIRQEYMKSIASNGLPGSNGYPLNLRKIAMVNGSLTGKNVGVAGEEDFRIHGFFKLPIGRWTAKVTEMHTKYMPNTGETINVSHIWRQAKPTHTQQYTNNNPHGSMDIVPGGLFDSEDRLHEKVMGNRPDVFGWNNDSLGIGDLFGDLRLLSSLGIKIDYFGSRVNKKVHSFVPTVSALGFKNSEFKWSEAVGDRNLVCTKEIPFDNYYGTAENTEHVSYTEKGIDWLYKELEADIINGPFPSPAVYLKNGDMVGDQVICGNETKTYSFEACKSPGKVTWDISEKLGIVSSTDESVTVKPINNTVYGNATIKATTPTQTIQKDTYIGKPSFSIKVNDCYSTTCRIVVENTNKQGILSVEWKKLDGNASISPSKYSATINGDSQGWGFYGKVTVKNSCGSTSKSFVVTSEGGLEQY